MTYQRLLDADPARVFSVLLDELSSSGRIDRVEGFGSAVSFRLRDGHPDHAVTMVASVRAQAEGTGTLLTLATRRPEDTPPLDEPGERRRLLLLADRVSDRA